LRSEFILELALALGLIGVLLIAGLRRRQLYLGLGKSGAFASPIRGLLDRPIPWTRLGPVSAALIGAGTLTFLAVGFGLPALGEVQAVLPAVLLFAAINAFNEETLFRAAPMAALEGALGRREATSLAVGLFAIPHYFGVPFGLVGVAMAAVLGWWLLKCLVETRGLVWPWIIHAVQDIMIFGVLLAGAGD
jgi:membrane protease YdiL (CAAX protease family)